MHTTSVLRPNGCAATASRTFDGFLWNGLNFRLHRDNTAIIQFFCATSPTNPFFGFEPLLHTNFTIADSSMSLDRPSETPKVSISLFDFFHFDHECFIGLRSKHDQSDPSFGRGVLHYISDRLVKKILTRFTTKKAVFHHSTNKTTEEEQSPSPILSRSSSKRQKTFTQSSDVCCCCCCVDVGCVGGS